MKKITGSFKKYRWVSVLTGLFAVTCWADEIENNRSNTPNNYRGEGISYPSIGPDTSKQIVDEVPLWRLLKEKKYTELEGLIHKYHNWYPNWHTPNDLVSELVHGKINDVKQQKGKNHGLKVIALADTHPDHFTCKNVHNMWALGDAYYAQSQKKQLLSLYSQLLDDCLDPSSRFITLQKASHQLSYQWAIDRAKLERYKPLLNKDKKKLNQFIYDAHAGWLANAIRRNKMKEGRRIAHYLKTSVVKRQDDQKAQLMGWWFLHDKKPNLARQWFARAYRWQPNGNSAYGLALVNNKLGKKNKAKSLAKTWQNKEPKMLLLLLELEAETANEAYTKKNHQKSLQYAYTVEKKAKKHKKKNIVDAMQSLIAWNLYKLQDYKEAATIFTHLYEKNPTVAHAKGVVLSVVELGEYQRVMDLASQQDGPLKTMLSSSPGTDQEMSDLYYLFYSGWMNHAAVNNNFSSAKIAGDKVSNLVMEKRDYDMALALGWSYLRTHQTEQAARLFQHSLNWKKSEGAAHGLALAKKQLGDPLGAEQLAEEWQEVSGPMRELRSELILNRADKAYTHGDFVESLQLSEFSHSILDSDRAVELSAWSHFHLGNTKVATDNFEQLYRKNPDKKTAKGLLDIGLASHVGYRLKKVADEVGGPLALLLPLRMSNQYYQQDLFILSKQLGGQANYLELKNIDSFSVAVQPYARHRSGEDGLGHMDRVGNVFQAKGGSGLHRFTLDLNFFYLDSEQPSSTANLGSLGSSWAFSPTESASALLEPFFSYRYESTYMPYLSVGSTPISGEVDPTIVGHMGLKHRHTLGTWDVKLFAKNIQESILSTTGIIDPYTGNSWGRVVDYGVQANAWQTLWGPWQISLDGKFGLLQGHNVKDNTHFSAGIRLGYSFDLKGFDYFVLGPRYRYEHYNDNHRFFTFGYGGYFSPSALHAGEMALNFQTDEGKQFIIQGQSSLGYQTAKEDDAVALPFSNTRQKHFTGSNNSGVAFHAKLTGAYRINKNFQIATFLNAIQSPDFTDIGGGLYLKFTFKARPAVFSTDLPDLPWNE